MLGYPGGPKSITRVFIKRMQEGRKHSRRRCCDTETRDWSVSRKGHQLKSAGGLKLKNSLLKGGSKFSTEASRKNIPLLTF